MKAGGRKSRRLVAGGWKQAAGRWLEAGGRRVRLQSGGCNADATTDRHPVINRDGTRGDPRMGFLDQIGTLG
jgi:hypothetical protein